MALTADIRLRRVGVPGDSTQPLSAPLGAAVTVYRGGVAVISGAADATKGYLKSGATTASTDRVIGMISQAAGGTAADTGPGITGGAANGDVVVEVETGSFLFTSGTAGDALTEANVGTSVYYGGEGTGTVLACATDGGGTRPVLGTMLPLDPTVPAGMVPVRTLIGGP